MAMSSLTRGLYMPQGDNTPNTKQNHKSMDILGRSRKRSTTSKAGSEDDPGSDSGAAGRAKPVLSEEQKKANHIYSEQRRREKIREQYDKLAELVPGMQGLGRSEARVLDEAVRYGNVLQNERAQLIQAIEERGGVVPPELKKY